MRFTKMHGAGNDYIFVDCFAQPVPQNPSALAVAVSDRHCGIGADGLILICPSDVADAQMRMWNADGSRGEMCGNGIRCLAKYLYEQQIARRETLTIETGRGLLDVQLETSAEQVERIRVDMGPPIVSPSEIPTTLPGTPPLDVELQVAGRTLTVTCLSMGNPHCVTFVETLNDDWVNSIGPALERHPDFPNRTNAEFVQVISPRELLVRVWERGSGETLACGTGACAAVVAGVLTERTDRAVAVRLPGGELHVEWCANDHLFLTGPAVEVFRGEWPD